MDTLGVPLFREEMRDIWKEQKHHVPSCIQDPPNVPLYTITGQAVKGGVRLPVLRCARGSTSLESFHLHLARSVLCALVQSCQTHQISTGTCLYRFNPGTSASLLHYQAYFIDGITRWNAARASAVIQSSSASLRTFNVRLQHKVYCTTIVTCCILGG